MSAKTESKKETMDRLFKENGLLAEDMHKHAHYTIINRMGIEKIQYKNGVVVRFEPVVMERDFCVVKAIAKRTEGNVVIEIETFGSASKETSQNKYYPEMSEKRALSRAVLKICNFYELGVFGEDEADDFKKKEDSSSKTAPIAETKTLTYWKEDSQPEVDPTNGLKALLDTLEGITTMYALNQFYNKYKSDWASNAEFKSACEKAKARIVEEEPAITISQKTQLLLILGHSSVTDQEKKAVLEQVHAMKKSTADAKIAYWKRETEQRTSTPVTP